MKERVIRHPAVSEALIARVELEHYKLIQLARLAARPDLDTDGQCAVKLAKRILELADRLRIDPYVRRAA